MTHHASNPLQAERTVLFVSLKPDSSYVDGLVAAKWQVVHAKTAQQVERLLERGAIRVGVVALPQECTEQQLAELEASVSHTEATWVALVQRGQADKPAVQRFIVDYCFDYVTMPCAEERLAVVLGHAYGLSELREKAAPPPPVQGCCMMIGTSEPMQQLYRGVEKCARTGAPVFIAGESGTGKELTARAIHERSARAGQPFVAINCAAIPPSLLQSELFGHERGAFTGALQRKIGRIEAASGGTLFLDEIGDMPHECQAVLLRFLQEATIERLGGTASIKIDARIVSATHVDLMQAIDAGRFRADLFHRLCVLRFDEPPLRQRGHDIKLLAYHALELHKNDGARKIRGFSSDAIAAMFNYPWPGNVRELINCVRRAVVMAEGRFITAADLGLPDAGHQRGRTLAEVRCEAERAAVRDALARHAYSLSSAAAELGVSRATLYRLLNSVGLRPEAPVIRHLGVVDGVAADPSGGGAPRPQQAA
ncbi:sigma-54 dependent transcriptional regulator [Trinickia caryophylli]|uniref:Sigma54 specific transcriptional regulator, Fis family n=1 Tax=Trinickia caryophylli TaxID=28094 RepID=A0A1X7CX23_TRICW|nr:sigma-54 dependent transcriptional regulator [Trinickia caryophylli]PMS13448.1 sigma-54-dependent Fis family transcriptional regulator [Trinickia caryophylli]TRX13695.1 sigma-54-dependent Fis family transcriptional regulator [Trinickia caryophylli]WQE15279.1 sigma-54 dependent transcriptional regulator [Trinickia caryophylli]SMF04606.1 sigma54 specific transcriptional regulator, Fis family [Trinickia caryophylli]GLU30969.1 sigma-54-dependent Fis family transcriptional regulator [Trinickia c